MKTKTYYTHFETIILKSLDLSCYDIEPKDLHDAFSQAYKIFQSEYRHNNNKHVSDVNLFAEYLQGLPSVCSVPFYNYEILQSALLNGIDVSSESKEDEYLSNYWMNLSKAFFTLLNNKTDSF